MQERKDMLREAIYSRRSTRRYRQDPVPEELLMEVVEAGRMAPSGNNRQNTHLIIVADPQNLFKLRGAMKDALANMPVREGMSTSLIGLMKQAKEGADVDVSYGAPVLILAANKKSSDNAMADSACALQNMMLMAAACGLGSCWINQFARFCEEPALRSGMEALGLQVDEGIYGALALGYAEKLETKPLPRTGNPVTKA